MLNVLRIKKENGKQQEIKTKQNQQIQAPKCSCFIYVLLCYWQLDSCNQGMKRDTTVSGNSEECVFEMLFTSNTC